MSWSQMLDRQHELATQLELAASREREQKTTGREQLVVQGDCHADAPAEHSWPAGNPDRGAETTDRF